MNTPSKTEQLSAAFRAYAVELQQFLRGRLRCPDTAADLTQETYLRLISHRGGPIENVRAFVFRIARNLVIDHVRASSRRSALDETIAYLYEVTGDSPELDNVVSAQQELAALSQALTELPPLTRAVFECCRLRHLSHQQIADELGVSISTVEKQMVRALEFLRARLER